MARTTIELTSSFQQIAPGRAVITVQKAERGDTISLNETASDASAMVRQAVAENQFLQMDDVATYAKGAGVTVIVDER